MPEVFHHPATNLDATTMMPSRVEIRNITYHCVQPTAGGFVRAEAGLHHQLGFRQAPGEPRTVPAPPTEAQLRTELAAALQAREAAVEGLSRATQAFERAEHRRQKAESHLATFLGLGDQMTAHAVAMARHAEHSDELLPEALERRLSDRTAAEHAHRAACDAATILRRELAEVSRRHGDAGVKVDALVMRLLGVAVADLLAAEIMELRGEIERRRESLLVFDRLCTPARVPMSRAVLQALGEANIRPLQPEEMARWQVVADALRADPEAELAIELPPLVVPKLPLLPSYGVSPAPGYLGPLPVTTEPSEEPQ
jgi:hypothetical protein